jgi:hypothetical protein
MALRNKETYQWLRRILEELWKFTQEKCWKPKGYTGEVEPKLNGQSWGMKYQILPHSGNSAI